MMVRLRTAQGLKPVAELREPLVGVVELRPRIRQVLAHQLEIGPEPLEVPGQPREVSQYLLRLLLDMHALEAQKNGLEVGVKTVRRNGDDPLLKGIVEEAFFRVQGLVLDNEFVVDVL